jgi:hypothetical protein
MSFILIVFLAILNYWFEYYVYIRFGKIYRYIGLGIYFIQLISQIYSTIINQGIPHRRNYLSEDVINTMYQYMKASNVKLDKYRICKACNIVVYDNQHVTHCDMCDICSEGKDFIFYIYIK